MLLTLPLALVLILSSLRTNTKDFCNRCILDQSARFALINALLFFPPSNISKGSAKASRQLHTVCVVAAAIPARLVFILIINSD